MAGKVAERQARLRERLVVAAEQQIRTGGLSSVKARDLARHAGCALGAIYTVFDDLTALILAVNGRTFHALGEAVSTAVDAADEDDPVEQLIIMSFAYLSFAQDHMHQWRTLFDVDMTEDQAPDWYLSEMENLFALIAVPLARLHPEMSKQDLGLLTRALFSSIHGIVLLGLEHRISAVPPDHLRHMIAMMLRRIA